MVSKKHKVNTYEICVEIITKNSFINSSIEAMNENIKYFTSVIKKEVLILLLKNI